MRLSIWSRSSGTGFFCSEETGSATRKALPDTTSPRMIRFTWQEYIFTLFHLVGGNSQHYPKTWAKSQFTGTSVCTLCERPQKKHELHPKGIASEERDSSMPRRQF